MADHPLASYALALLALIGNQEDVIENSPLGTARRIGAETSTSDVLADKPLQAMIEHSSSHGNDGSTIFGGTCKVRNRGREEKPQLLIRVKR